jgi:hypothetical protein
MLHPAVLKVKFLCIGPQVRHAQHNNYYTLGELPAHMPIYAFPCSTPTCFLMPQAPTPQSSNLCTSHLVSPWETSIYPQQFTPIPSARMMLSDHEQLVHNMSRFVMVTSTRRAVSDGVLLHG